jgi:hypothetical protein
MAGKASGENDELSGGESVQRASQAAGRRRMGRFTVAGCLGLAVLIVIAARYLKRRDRGAGPEGTMESNQGLLAPRSTAEPHVSSVDRQVTTASLQEPAEAGQEDEDDPKGSFWRHFAHERLVRLPKEHRIVRRAVLATGILAIAGAGAIVAGTRVPSTTVLVRASFTGSEIARVSWGALAIGALGTVAAWALVLSGVFLTHWKVRLPALSVFTAAALTDRHEFPALSVFAGLPGIGVLAGFIFLGALTVTADWASGSRWHLRIGMDTPVRTRIIAMSVVFLVVIAYVSQAVRLGGHGSAGNLALRSVWGFQLLFVTVIIVIPMLLLAGADIADMSGEISKGMRRGVARQSPLTPRLAAAGFAVIGIAVASYSLRASILTDIIPAALMITVLVVIARTGRLRGRPVKPLLPLAVGAAIFVFLLDFQVATGVQKIPAASVVQISPPVKPFAPPSEPVFSIRYPEACLRPVNDSKGLFTEYDIIGCTPVKGSYSFSFAIISFLARQVPGISDACSITPHVVGPGLDYMKGPPAPGWCTTTFTYGGNRDIAWTRIIASRAWLLLGQAASQPVTYRSVEPLLDLMRQYWRPTAAVAPLIPEPITNSTGNEAASIDRLGKRTGILWFALAAAGTALLIWRRRRADRRLKQALLYLITSGLWFGVSFLQAGTASSRAGSALPRLEIGGILTLAGLAALGMVAVLALRGVATGGCAQGNRPSQQEVIPRRLGDLLVFSCSLLLIWGAATLYGQAAQAGTMSAIYQGIIIVVALAWEFIFSGELLNTRLSQL